MFPYSVWITGVSLRRIACTTNNSHRSGKPPMTSAGIYEPTFYYITKYFNHRFPYTMNFAVTNHEQLQDGMIWRCRMYKGICPFLCDQGVWGMEVQLHSFLTTSALMKVSNQLGVPAVLTPSK